MVGIKRLLACVVALTSAVQGVAASPVAEPDNTLERRQGGFFPVTGSTEGGNAPRLEIRRLATTGRQWNLFIQAMERFQKFDQSKLTSYYSVAGIHGQPYVSWDRSNGRGGAGYCPHSSNLFGPWHRPYLALVEQRLHFFAVQIANEFGAAERGAYRNAAATLRLPYWDWASGQIPVMPTSVTSPQIRVTRPNGQGATIANPLFAYRFHPLRPGDFGNSQPIAGYLTTKRAPNSGAPNAASQNGRVEANLRGSAGSYKSRIYNLFTRQQSYNHFSNHGSGSNGDTLESVHDSIHASFGANAHMVFITFSSYDPIFWLHHCNVDRMLAIWQQLYPGTYVTPFRQSGGTYTIAPGSTQDANSPLTPFHRTAGGAFWSSGQARSTNAFHYTYPEIQDNPSQATLRGRINRLYGPQAQGVSRNVASRKAKRAPVLDTTDVPLNISISPGENVYEYVASVTMPLNPLGGTYTLSVFLGPYDESPEDWMTADNYVGSHSILAMDNMINTDVLVTGEIVLTEPLLKKFATGELKALDQDTVVQYVHDNMQWGIEMNGQYIPTSKVPKVSVTLVSNLVKAPTSDVDFPTTLDTTEHGNVTETMANYLM